MISYNEDKTIQRSRAKDIYRYMNHKVNVKAQNGGTLPIEAIRQGMLPGKLLCEVIVPALRTARIKVNSRFDCIHSIMVFRFLHPATTPSYFGQRLHHSIGYHS